METRNSSLGRWLSASAGQAVFWAMPLARMLMCGLLYLSIPSAAQGSAHLAILQRFSTGMARLDRSDDIWSICGTAAANGPRRFVVLDRRGDGGCVDRDITRRGRCATIAFALSATVFALGLRIGRKLIFATLMIAPLALVLRDPFALFFVTITPKAAFVRAGATEIITAALQILAVFTLIIWANRRYIVEKFSNDFSSLRMLSLERSFEFDLQVWTDALASLFGPDRAAA